MRTSLFVSTLGFGLLVTSLAAAGNPKAGDDPTPHPTPHPASTPTPAAPPAPAPAPAVTPMAAGEWDMVATSTAAPGRPAQTLNLDATVTSVAGNGAASVVDTRPVPGMAPAVSTGAPLTLTFNSLKHCTGNVVINGQNIAFSGAFMPTTTPTVSGTFLSTQNGHTASGTWTITYARPTPPPTPIAKMAPLKQFGASGAPAASQSLWSRFSSWCSGFAL